jgi:hypothetical protein
MKYKAKDYAKAIIQAKKADAAVILRLLQKNGDMKKAKEIIALIKKSLYRNITIETARKVQMKWPKQKSDLVEEKIAPGLIAGARITIDGERQLDFSLKNKLKNIFT